MLDEKSIVDAVQIRMVRKGSDWSEMADDLGITPRQLKGRLENILGKRGSFRLMAEISAHLGMPLADLISVAQQLEEERGGRA